MKYAKVKAPETYKPRNVEILSCLFSQPQWLNLLYGLGKPYEKLLDHILRVSKMESLDSPEDSNIRVISEVINEKPAVVAKWIPKIYDDLFDLNEKSPQLFEGPGQKYDLSFKSTFYKGDYFTLWLPTRLMKYDNFIFSFISAKIGVRGSFWVENVYHYYSKGCQSISVYLNPRLLNPYREYILAQAEFHNLINSDDKFALNDFQIDERLRELFGKHHIR